MIVNYDWVITERQIIADPSSHAAYSINPELAG